MKSKSHRLPTPTAPMDDWIDGSWTVDCPCGVTFDDGEEMVKCDECGVWVHTRCSRFVKDEASFTCDKCNGKTPIPPSADRVTPAATNIEETEVAQLLAELPTKADPCPPPVYQRTGFKRWAERPMEEKVHVQGIPGGDSTLFAGLSTIFSQELWKCTGYVAKKFNFKYREFPCWDGDEGENPASTGADLLFSLSKESMNAAAAEGVERPPLPSIGLKSSDAKAVVGAGHNYTKKGRSKFRGPGLHSGKQREDESGASKYKGSRRIRIPVPNQRNRGTEHIGSGTRLDGNEFGLTEKVALCGSNLEREEMKREDRRVDKPLGSSADLCSEGKSGKDHVKSALSTKSLPSVAETAASKHRPLTDMHVKESTADVEGYVCNGTPSRASESTKSFPHIDLIVESSVKEDSVNNGGVLKQADGTCNEHIISQHASSINKVELKRLEHAVGDSGSASFVLPPSTLVESTNAFSKETWELNKEKFRSDFDQSNRSPKLQSPVIDKSDSKSLLIGHAEKSSGSVSIDLQNHEMPCEAQLDESDNGSKPVNKEISEPECARFGSDQGMMEAMDKLPETQNPPSSCREPVNLESMSSERPTSTGHKLVVAIEKPSSSPNAQDKSKLSNPGSHKSPVITPTSTSDGSPSSTAARTVPFTKRSKVNKSTINRQETLVTGLSNEGNVHVETSEQSKGSAISEDKLSKTSKAIHASSTKHKSIESKENMTYPSKTLSTENSASSSGYGRLGGPPQTQSTLVQVKLAPSESGMKSMRKTSPSYQTSSRASSHPSAMLPPIPPSATNSSITLSDEELAKRLHHELNSSPRVSRVPRGLHASGIQFASSTSASMLSKQSSSLSSMGKQVSVSKRKNKEDAAKDDRHYREAADKDVKQENLSFSSHEKQCEASHVSDSIKKDDLKSPNILSPTLESPVASVAVDGSGPHFLTLPGLINEIMNDGKHMTYEELCNAVLLHWPSLRKPNGEPYPYPSHSLAVLDCLRNRNEWNHLIDYEPKIYSSKKRIKSSASPSIEGSSNGKANRSLGRDERNDESCPKHLPTKGKRLARKRRKLMLRGRAVQMMRGREIDDAVSDDDLQSLSGEEGSQSFSSKDETHGRRRHNGTSGISSSSQEESD